MTLEQLSRLNEKFQQKASGLAELLPGSNLLTFSTTIIRTTKKLDVVLKKVLNAKSEGSFYTQIEAMEEEMDELIFMMDRLDEANRKRNIGTITDVVKAGYELVSLYSLCCDQILERKTKKQDEIE
ncbi:hypothetical protein [Marinoscillum sp. 108]|jgi:flagellin-specific chaperone FliS|uniref:Uncharacterized protein n=1 Tax=Marinoscillum luteum TaxID=861051 RepID=A0ABW7N2Y7_9BACT|nr:hypothetical protein [Marinoscillum sp. 108]VXD15956.1 conserved hypothetical protein [Marinoscillum sp. 108]